MEFQILLIISAAARLDDFPDMGRDRQGLQALPDDSPLHFCSDMVTRIQYWHSLTPSQLVGLMAANLTRGSRIGTERKWNPPPNGLFQYV